MVVIRKKFLACGEAFATSKQSYLRVVRESLIRARDDTSRRIYELSH